MPVEIISERNFRSFLLNTSWLSAELRYRRSSARRFVWVRFVVFGLELTAELRVFALSRLGTQQPSSVTPLFGNKR